MPLVVGLVGDPGSGKTTIFETLQAAPGGASFAPGPGGTHIRAVEVHDDRLARLVEVHLPKKHTPVSIRFIDFPGRGGKGEQRVAALREVDAFLIVVRRFALADSTPPPVEETVGRMHEDWILSDLEVVENRLRRLEKSARRNPTSLEKKETALLEGLRQTFGEGGGFRQVPLSAEEERMTRGFAFLTGKPSQVVVNIGEREARIPPSTDPGVVVIRGQVEKEIAELPEEDRAAFLEEMGVKEPAWLRIPREALRALDVVTFYTCVGEEIRAWTLPRGGSVLEAAGRIHADMARGFVRAEVLAFEDFAAPEGPPPTKRKGRLEGRDYVVRDGDILTIRFA